ncbi:MAG: hypothetical protein WD737_06205, partial [Gemmatimonadota bacterium]
VCLPISVSILYAVFYGTGPVSSPPRTDEDDMYGLIGSMNATAGQRDRLIDVLLQGTQAMDSPRRTTAHE